MEGLALQEPGAGEPLERHRQEAEQSFRLLAEPSAEAPFQLDLSPLLLELARSRLRGGLRKPGPWALRFHRTVAAAALAGARELRRRAGQEPLALSGGVFQNVLLLDLLLPALSAEGFEVYIHRQLPPGDGGLAVGQVYFDSDI